MNPSENTEIAIEESHSLAIENVKLYSIVVYNDDVNSFDHVINTLIEVCNHSSMQAEQCTLLIHHKGKCKVKEGDFEELAAMRNEICRRGISAEVELN